jgi:hypothetical protein
MEVAVCKKILKGLRSNKKSIIIVKSRTNFIFGCGGLPLHFTIKCVLQGL